MSRFFSKSHSDLVAYTPGEQPQNREYIKLNTNESPFPPSPIAMRLSRLAASNLNLYSDPTCSSLVSIACEKFNINKEEIIFGNGSDDILNLIFSAFCDGEDCVAFADITYGFYSVLADLHNIKPLILPLKDDYSICLDDYIGIKKNIFIANPNAPTGIFLEKEKIEKIVVSNPDNIVVIDEAYVDFGGDSCIDLVHKYNNLLVVQTFSKSRSLAGGRLGFAVGNKDLIKDLNTIKYSINPYSVNSITIAAGIGALSDEQYFKFCCNTIISNRDYVTQKLTELGFKVLKSTSNFVFTKSDYITGEDLYLKLKEKGVLVRHFKSERISDFVRITISDKESMDILIKNISIILGNEDEN